jgi:hypothetical protein
MYEKVPFSPPSSVVGERVSERKDRVDMTHIRQNDARTGFDHVMEEKRGPVVPVIGPEGFRLGPVRVQDRKNVGDASGPVMDKLIETADRE